MKQLFFIIGFIWLPASVLSVLLGPLVGFNRARVKLGVKAFWFDKSRSHLATVLARATLAFAFLGFYIPVLWPIVGFIAGVFFLGLGGNSK